MLANKEHLLCERGLSRILPFKALCAAMQDHGQCGTEHIAVLQGVVSPNQALGVARGDRRKKEKKAEKTKTK